MKHEAKITQDITGKKIVVTREFNAPPEKIWRAYTEREILDKWWAPKPWKMETQTLDLRPGSIWHFCMINENGERYYWRVNYLAIEPQRSITTTGGPCDEKANFTGTLPTMQRFTEFTATPTGTLVTITVNFESEDDLRKMAGSGMLSGVTIAFENLEALLESNAI